MNLNDVAFMLIGGGGFMGSAFADHLASNGIEVIKVLRGDSLEEARASASLNAGRRWVVVDFAYTSVPNSSFDDPVKDYSDNLYNLLRHAEFVRGIPGAIYVYISSGGTVYGNPDLPVPIDENHRNVPLAPYGITKLACERYVLMYSQVHGLDVRIVRPSNVYGPGQRPYRGQGIVATMLACLIEGKPIRLFGDGSTIRDYLYVNDFCRALEDVVCGGQNGEIYNLGTGEGTNIKQLLDRFQSHLGLRTLVIERLPMRPFDVRYNVLECSKLRSLNRWKPTTTFDEGLATSTEWLRANIPRFT